MSKLNTKLEYLPITRELKDISSLKSRDMWIEQSGEDKFNNPRFQIDNTTSCTVSVSKNGKWYNAFLVVMDRNFDNSQNKSFFRSFAARSDYEETNDSVYFEEFREVVKDEVSGRWVEKDKQSD